MNPLFKDFNPYSDIVRQAKEMERNFKGNPREEVQRLLTTGEMSQADFNRLAQIANQIMPFMR